MEPRLAADVNSGSGYEFVADFLMQLDAKNP
jgi:hypothetical protein